MPEPAYIYFDQQVRHAVKVYRPFQSGISDEDTAPPIEVWEGIPDDPGAEGDLGIVRADDATGSDCEILDE